MEINWRQGVTGLRGRKLGGCWGHQWREIRIYSPRQRKVEWGGGRRFKRCTRKSCQNLNGLREREAPGSGCGDRWRSHSLKLGPRREAPWLGGGPSGGLSCGPSGFRMPEQHPRDMLTCWIDRGNKMKF